MSTHGLHTYITIFYYVVFPVNITVKNFFPDGGIITLLSVPD